MVRKAKNVKGFKKKMNVGQKMAMEYEFALVNFTASSILEGKDGDVVRADLKKKADELVSDMRAKSGLELAGLDITGAEIEPIVEKANELIKYMEKNSIKPIENPRYEGGSNEN